MNKFLISAFIILSACGSKEKNTTNGNVDRDGIRTTILSNRKVVSQCYGKELAKNPPQKLVGKILINFDINAEGKAQKANVLPKKSTLQNTDLAQCITTQLQTWNFPKPPDGQIINVSFPFLFNDTPARNMQQKLDQFKKIKGDKTPK